MSDNPGISNQDILQTAIKLAAAGRITIADVSEVIGVGVKKSRIATVMRWAVRRQILTRAMCGFDLGPNGMRNGSCRRLPRVGARVRLLKPHPHSGRAGRVVSTVGITDSFRTIKIDGGPMIVICGGSPWRYENGEAQAP